MRTIFFEQRREIIMDLLKNKGSVSLSELCSIFNISAATVRRDLRDMEEQGDLKRTHGGAVSVSRSVFEREYAEVQKSQIEEKKSIARVVAELVENGDSILLDSGTTTEQIASMLSTRDITIITNSDTIPPDIEDFKPIVYKAGGLYRPVTKSTVGPQAEKFISGFRPDKAFIAANGVNCFDITTPHISEGTVKEAMMACAKEKYLVVDHTKFGLEFLSAFAKIQEFDAIITDEKVDDETIEFYHSYLIPVITEKNMPFKQERGEFGLEPTEIMKPELVNLDLKSTDKTGAICELIKTLADEHIVEDTDAMLQAVLKREEEFSTGIGFKIAIPHAKSSAVKRASIAIGRSRNGVSWPSDDGNTVNLIFLVAVPMEAENQHLKLLAKISRSLIHDEIRSKLMDAKTPGEIIKILN